MANAIYPIYKQNLLAGTAGYDLDNNTVADGPYLAAYRIVMPRWDCIRAAIQAQAQRWLHERGGKTHSTREAEAAQRV